MKFLSRRSLLRGSLAGATVSVALPRLGSMLNGNGTAYASGEGLPRRFGLWTSANGMIASKWVPTTTGPNYALSPALAPLQSVKPLFSVLTGFTGGFGFRPHAAGHTAFMTGTPYKGTNDDTYTAARESIDQTVAGLIGANTAFRSLELGVDQAFPPERGSAFHWWSHKGPNSPNPCMYDAKAVFDRLFSDFKPAVAGQMTGPSAATVARQMRKSILDVVLQDAADLKADLGQEDRHRLDAHLDSVRRIEQRLATADTAAPVGASCKVPAAVTAKFDSAASDYDIRGPAVNKMMAQLLGVAMACDLTRVFTFQFLQPGSRFRSSKLGVLDEFHIRTHNPSQADKVNEIVTFINGELRTFIEVLRDIPEGDGSLLDNCAILATNDCGDGVTHGQAEFPLIVIGKGGGKLRTGLHHRSTTSERGFKVLLSLARAAGANLASFGEASTKQTEGVTAIEV